jgi:signal transduction histidine kinase
MRSLTGNELRPASAWLMRDVRLAALIAVVMTLSGTLALGLLKDPPLPLAQLARDLPGRLLWDLGIFTAMLIGISCALRAQPRSMAARWAGLVVLVLLVSAGAVALRTIEFGMRHDDDTLDSMTWTFNISLVALLVALRVFELHSRRAADSLHAAEVGRLALQGEVAQARLTLLQAQIEPHFLFNSLANARRLLRTDSAAARSLLVDLLRYFEEALPRLRDERATYLAVHQVRMGERLRAEIDVPHELAGCAVPPMALLTLVENALKHGLQPLVEGGSIRIAASAHDGVLTLTVADTGRGMGSGSGHGTGLANLRARLLALHGNAACLALRLNDPRGVVAVITLPQAP